VGLDKGDRVRHPTFGTGVVRRKLVLQSVVVQFDGTPHLARTLRLSELEPTEAVNGRNAEHGPAPRTEYRPRLERDEAWQTLEALRLGVVPARGVRDYTVAREEELANVAALLAEGAGCRVLWGDYGAGKTHLLDAAEQLALEQGFATARITLDPRENALHHPLRLYRHVADSVRSAEQVAPGFEALFERLGESPDHYRPDGARASRFFSPYLHALRHGDAEQIGWLRDYARGDNVGAVEVNQVLARLRWSGLGVLRMSDYRTYGRMYVHLVGTLACWCADAGTRGLVLLFDEVERVDALAMDDRQYAFEVLRHYAAVTMDAADLAFDPESLYKGGHEVHRALPLRFKESQPLVTLFALTPLEEIRRQFESLTSSPAYDLRLAPLRPALLAELVERIAALYERAYAGHSVSAAVRGSVCRRIAEDHEGGHDSFRDAVRSTVFQLDADRLG